ncbi:MAG: hypothetical protein B7Z37_19340 [Verrucomicrobia bacterium 12-59-8]|nr:MAG: hypothetical protein B7Z37_19340 [Verrucomicrobia bacterium 12-59-8]
MRAVPSSAARLPEACQQGDWEGGQKKSCRVATAKIGNSATLIPACRAAAENLRACGQVSGIKVKLSRDSAMGTMNLPVMGKIDFAMGALSSCLHTVGKILLARALCCHGAVGCAAGRAGRLAEVLQPTSLTASS